MSDSISWSEKLFLKINSQIGRHPWFDRFMRFGAHDALYFLTFLVLFWATGVLFINSPKELEIYLKLLITAGAFGFATSWIIAFISPRTRPIVQFPNSKELIIPLSTWKSFPSDHTIAAFTIVGVTWIIGGAPIWFLVVLFLLASWVATGRVYAGVHYPNDILGGLLIAILFSLTAPWLLVHITQPLYHIFNLLFI